MSRVWHEDDTFWDDMMDVLFPPSKWEDSRDEVRGALALAGTAAGARVLNLGCGPGRHALELARRGYVVTGVNRTVRYLDRARAAAREESLEIELVEADMRAFVRPEAFDLAVNLYTSFSYFEDPEEDRTVARNLFESLAPGGALVMDMMGKEVLARIFQQRSWSELEDGTLLLEHRQLSQGWGWIGNRWILVRDGEVKEYTFGHRLYSAAELAALLGSVGFASVECYGHLGGDPYDQEARHLVAVARKQVS